MFGELEERLKSERDEDVLAALPEFEIALVVSQRETDSIKNLRLLCRNAAPRCVDAFANGTTTDLNGPITEDILQDKRLRALLRCLFWLTPEDIARHLSTIDAKESTQVFKRKLPWMLLAFAGRYLQTSGNHATAATTTGICRAAANNEAIGEVTNTDEKVREWIISWLLTTVSSLNCFGPWPLYDGLGVVAQCLYRCVDSWMPIKQDKLNQELGSVLASVFSSQWTLQPFPNSVCSPVPALLRKLSNELPTVVAPSLRVSLPLIQAKKVKLPPLLKNCVWEKATGGKGTKVGLQYDEDGKRWPMEKVLVLMDLFLTATVKDSKSRTELCLGLWKTVLSSPRKDKFRFAQTVLVGVSDGDMRDSRSLLHSFGSLTDKVTAHFVHSLVSEAYARCIRSDKTSAEFIGAVTGPVFLCPQVFAVGDVFPLEVALQLVSSFGEELCCCILRYLEERGKKTQLQDLCGSVGPHLRNQWPRCLVGESWTRLQTVVNANGNANDSRDETVHFLPVVALLCASGPFLEGEEGEYPVPLSSRESLLLVLVRQSFDAVTTNPTIGNVTKVFQSVAMIESNTSVGVSLPLCRESLATAGRLCNCSAVRPRLAELTHDFLRRTLAHVQQQRQNQPSQEAKNTSATESFARASIFDAILLNLELRSLLVGKKCKETVLSLLHEIYQDAISFSSNAEEEFRYVKPVAGLCLDLMTADAFSLPLDILHFLMVGNDNEAAAGPQPRNVFLVAQNGQAPSLPEVVQGVLRAKRSALNSSPDRCFGVLAAAVKLAGEGSDVRQQVDALLSASADEWLYANGTRLELEGEIQQFLGHCYPPSQSLKDRLEIAREKERKAAERERLRLQQEQQRREAAEKEAERRKEEIRRAEQRAKEARETLEQQQAQAQEEEALAREKALKEKAKELEKQRRLAKEEEENRRAVATEKRRSDAAQKRAEGDLLSQLRAVGIADSVALKAVKKGVQFRQQQGFTGAAAVPGKSEALEFVVGNVEWSSSQEGALPAKGKNIGDTSSSAPVVEAPAASARETEDTVLVHALGGAVEATPQAEGVSFWDEVTDLADKEEEEAAPADQPKTFHQQVSCLLDLFELDEDSPVFTYTVSSSDSDCDSEEEYQWREELSNRAVPLSAIRILLPLEQLRTDGFRDVNHLVDVLLHAGVIVWTDSKHQLLSITPLGTEYHKAARDPQVESFALRRRKAAQTVRRRLRQQRKDARREELRSLRRPLPQQPNRPAIEEESAEEDLWETLGADEALAAYATRNAETRRKSKAKRKRKLKATAQDNEQSEDTASSDDEDEGRSKRQRNRRKNNSLSWVSSNINWKAKFAGLRTPEGGLLAYFGVSKALAGRMLRALLLGAMIALFCYLLVDAVRSSGSDHQHRPVRRIR